MTESALSPPYLRLIDALAEKAAADYLSAEDLARQASNDERTNPAPLPHMDQAA